MQAFIRVLCGAALLAAGAVAARRNRRAQTAKDKRVAVFMGPTQDKYLGALSGSFKTAAEGHGMKITVYSSPFDPALQAQQIDDAIAQKFDLMVVQIISQRAIIRCSTRVKNANIPVRAGGRADGRQRRRRAGPLCHLRRLRRHHVRPDRSARRWWRRRRPRAASSAKIAILAGSMAEGKAPLREKAFREAVAKTPGHGGRGHRGRESGTRRCGERAAGQLLARFAGQGGLNGFYGMNDVVANGAIQAAESAGLKVGTAAGKLIVVGGNCQAPGVKNIEAGKQAATLADAAGRGGQARRASGPRNTSKARSRRRSRS